MTCISTRPWTAVRCPDTRLSMGNIMQLVGDLEKCNGFLDLLWTEQQQHKVSVQPDAKEDLGLQSDSFSCQENHYRAISNWKCSKWDKSSFGLSWISVMD